jgi:hypothetical protein
MEKHSIWGQLMVCGPLLFLPLRFALTIYVPTFYRHFFRLVYGIVV